MGDRPGIVVVGAGPTGLTLACLLLRRGAPCRVIDAGAEATQRSRAIGVSARSLEVLDELGIAERLVDLGLPSREAIFYSAGRPVGRLTASATRDTRFPFLLAVPQSATEAVLEARLVELGGRVERGVRLSELRDDDRSGTVSLTLESPDGSTAAEAAWVAGADGSHSVVRRDAGIDFVGDATGSVFANVDTLLANGPAPGVGHYFFSPQGMLVIAPLPDDIYRVTASISAAEADGPLTLDDVQGFVTGRGARDVEVRELRDAGWGVARIPIQTRVASRFRAGRCLLAGDAAHIYGPTGAQGMNGGIQDAQALAWRLALVSTGRAPDTVLDGYARERRAVATVTLHHVEQQTRLATARSRWAAGARDGFLGVASRTGLLDRALAPRINQFDVRYRDPTSVPRRTDRATGRRVPNVALTGPDGGSTTLFAVLAEHWLTVLVTGARPSDAAQVRSLAGRLAERHGDMVGLVTIGAHAAGGTGLVDRDRRLHRFLGSAPGASLIRPDHHVAVRAPLLAPEPLLALLRDLLPGPPA
jgi:2-polyprenyl-6-methoxyphenol hydroxylase-like FAD-dependent oxidoreductase